MMAIMTEDQNEYSDEQIREIAEQRVHTLQRIIAALMIEGVDQIRATPQTWQHEEVSVTTRDLAEEALAVSGIEPPDVLVSATRISSVLIVELCKRLDVDPAQIVKAFEEAYFRLSL
jgi:hypothetical protein